MDSLIVAHVVMFATQVYMIVQIPEKVFLDMALQVWKDSLEMFCLGKGLPLDLMKLLLNVR